VRTLSFKIDVNQNQGPWPVCDACVMMLVVMHGLFATCWQHCIITTLTNFFFLFCMHVQTQCLLICPVGVQLSMGSERLKTVDIRIVGRQ
jgi:hypothetical protein